MTKQEKAHHLVKKKQIDLSTAYVWLRTYTWEECLKRTKMTKSQAAKRSRKAQGQSKFRLPGSPLFKG